MVERVSAALRALDPDQRLAGLAATALLITLFLPWYDATVVERGSATSPTFSAFGVFTFVEAAILLVVIGVYALLFARGEQRAFHLPGGDGTVIFGAGLWAAVLLLWRVFDRPDIDRAVQVGITWGFFFAFVAAAALAGAGWRIRQAARPEPPNPTAAEPPPPAPAPAPRPEADTAPTERVRPGEIPPAPRDR